jgi:hypothetical protein
MPNSDNSNIPDTLLKCIANYRQEFPDTLVTRLIELSYLNDSEQIDTITSCSKNSRVEYGERFTFDGNLRPNRNKADHDFWRLRSIKRLNYSLDSARRVEEAIDEKIKTVTDMYEKRIHTIEAELQELKQKLVEKEDIPSPQPSILDSIIDPDKPISSISTLVFATLLMGAYIFDACRYRPTMLLIGTDV